MRRESADRLTLRHAGGSKGGSRRRCQRAVRQLQAFAEYVEPAIAVRAHETLRGNERRASRLRAGSTCYRCRVYFSALAAALLDGALTALAG